MSALEFWHCSLKSRPRTSALAAGFIILAALCCLIPSAKASATKPCPRGLLYYAKNDECLDMDECASSDQLCAEKEICINTRGSYECICRDGGAPGCSSTMVEARLSKPAAPLSCSLGMVMFNSTCLDIDECATGHDDCEENAKCVNTEGSFHCACREGYDGDGRNECWNVDECRRQSHRCHDNALCRDTDGSYTCHCRAGFEGDGFECSDIDECRNPRRHCHHHADCFNAPGSFRCECRSGFHGNGRRRCKDVDECQAATVAGMPLPCHHLAVCYNTPGAHRCECDTGYEGDGFNQCHDADECSSGTHDCDANTLCTNTNGSFVCSCRDAFSGDGYLCTDVDECQRTPPVCPENSACWNAKGSYQCSCHQGYAMNVSSGVCVDIDECLARTHACSFQGICENSRPSYTCRCRAGFVGNGVTCADVDECAGRAHDCHRDAECHNVAGSFRCECHDGHTGSGQRCSDVDECDEASTAPSSSSSSASRQPHRHNCHGNASCTNRHGSFVCACRDGFAGDGVECRDVDECAPDAGELRRCHGNASCENTVGAFACTCLPGHRGNGTWCEELSADQELQSLLKLPIDPKMAARRILSISSALADISADEKLVSQLADVLDAIVAGMAKAGEAVDVGTMKEVLQTVSNIEVHAAEALSQSQKNGNSSARLVTNLDRMNQLQPLSCSKNAEGRISVLESSSITLGVADFKTASGSGNASESAVVFGSQAAHTRARRQSAAGARQDAAVPASARPVASEAPDLGKAADGDADAEMMASEVSISLPRSALRQAKCLHSHRSDIACPRRVLFSLHSRGKLFRERQGDTTLEQDAVTAAELAEAEIKSRVVVSPVISARIYDVEHADLEDAANVTFAMPEAVNGVHESHDLVCAFWNFSADGGQGGWSSDGCRLIASPSTDNNLQATCSCTHLTNFALLLSKKPLGTSKALAAASYVGCALSICGLLLTLTAHVFFRGFRKMVANQIIAGISLSLLLLLVFFLLATSKYFTASHNMCTFGSMAIHFFLLSAFCWMAVGGYNLYIQLIKVFKRGTGRHFLAKAIAFSYGAPAVVLAITAGVALDSYTDNQSCRLHGYAFYIAMVAPLCLLLTCNFVVFGTLAWSMSSVKTMASQATRHRRRTRLRSYVGLTTLLGLTWASGLLLLVTSHPAVQWTFTVLVSSQGFFIFVLQVATHRLVKRQLSTKSVRHMSRRISTPSSLSIFRLTRFSHRRATRRGNSSLSVESRSSDVRKARSLYLRNAPTTNTTITAAANSGRASSDRPPPLPPTGLVSRASEVSISAHAAADGHGKVQRTTSYLSSLFSQENAIPENVTSPSSDVVFVASPLSADGDGANSATSTEAGTPAARPSSLSIRLPAAVPAPQYSAPAQAMRTEDSGTACTRLDFEKNNASEQPRSGDRQDGRQTRTFSGREIMVTAV